MAAVHDDMWCWWYDISASYVLFFCEKKFLNYGASIMELDNNKNIVRNFEFKLMISFFCK